MDRIWERILHRRHPVVAPVVSYTTEPAHPSRFTLSARRIAEAEAGKRGYVFLSYPNLVRVSKSERWGGLLNGLGPISAQVSNGILEFIGIPHGPSFIEYEARAHGRTESQARELLQKVEIQQIDDTVRLVSPRAGQDLLCTTEFVITCVRQRPVYLRGDYSAIRLSDMSGGVDVETSHARITLLNVTSQVRAQVEEGIIDYSGHQALAQLFAGWELNLNFTMPTFTGTMDATAEGPVRVLLPPGFNTPFEASVAKGSEFVCRAGISSQITKRERAGRSVFEFRQGDPLIRLTSRKGPIVIDTRAEPSVALNESLFA